MTEDKIKEQNNYVLNMKRTAAQSISSLFPDVESVHIHAITSFQSGVFKGFKEKEYNFTLYPSNLLFVHFPCANRDCTGMGFDITDVVRECLSEHKSVEDRCISCDGKEDWKYIGHSGCTCLGELVFSVFPSFR